jgi:hypothetical protein
MTGSLSQPRIFISYSWTTPQHEQWVLQLAERLSSDGINVLLDKWDLKEGQDKHAFMEQMVNDPNVQKVLVICDKGYQSKADGRKGGVGTETQLISKEVYDRTSQEKFIPIIKEHDEDGSPCVPKYIASRIYIDLSSEDEFEANYEKLIRNLYGKPLLQRPAVGVPPAYINEEAAVVVRSTKRIASIKESLLNDRRSVKGQISEYLQRLLEDLNRFRIAGGNAPNFDEKVLESIEQLKPLRDDFIDLVLTLSTYQEQIDLEQLHAFWEGTITFLHRPESAQSWTESDFDNFRFFNYELFLWFITILLRAKRFSEAAYFLSTPYFYRNDVGTLKNISFPIFNVYVRSLDERRNLRLSLQRVSVTADLIKSRATRADVPFAGIRDTDLILHYVGLLHQDSRGWFPRTSVFGGHWLGIDFFERMASRRHFEKTCIVLGVQSKEELKNLMVKSMERRAADPYRYGPAFEYDIRPLENVLEIDKIATLP